MKYHKPLSKGNFLFHEACEKCGSSDGKAVYDNNTASCFVCKGYFSNVDGMEEDESDGVDTSNKKDAKWITDGSYMDISNRKLKEEICRHFSYQIGKTDDGTPCHIAHFYDPKNRRLIAQKLRKKGKKFSIIGTGKGLPFFGQHLYNGGKRLTITEGEIDALSVAQAMGMGKWPVVSLPNGASSVTDTFTAQYEWLNTFDEIVLCFDQDEAGRVALEAALPLIPAGKAYVMSLPCKDANETLIEHGPEAISNAFWNRAEWRPDGIIAGHEISLESLRTAISRGFTTAYPKFNETYGGVRKREILLFTAGSGIGKSTLAREVAYGLHQDHNLIIGNVFLEESKEKTAQGYIAIDNNVPLGRLRADPEIITMEAWEKSHSAIINNRMYFYDHFGSLESDRLLAKLNYMATALKCDFIILDHISIVVSGQEGSGEGERRDIDRLMTNLRSLVEETGVGIIAIVHLKQPEGKPHEEGGRVTLSQLRGSGSLKQLSDGVLAMERDQQGENASHSLMRLLKNREFGDTGEIDTIKFDKETGRLLPTEPLSSDDGFDDAEDDDVPF